MNLSYAAPTELSVCSLKPTTGMSDGSDKVTHLTPEVGYLTPY